MRAGVKAFRSSHISSKGPSAPTEIHISVPTESNFRLYNAKHKTERVNNLVSKRALSAGTAVFQIYDLFSVKFEGEDSTLNALSAADQIRSSSQFLSIAEKSKRVKVELKLAKGLIDSFGNPFFLYLFGRPERLSEDNFEFVPKDWVDRVASFEVHFNLGSLVQFSNDLEAAKNSETFSNERRRRGLIQEDPLFSVVGQNVFATFFVSHEDLKAVTDEGSHLHRQRLLDLVNILRDDWLIAKPFVVEGVIYDSNPKFEQDWDCSDNECRPGELLFDYEDFCKEGLYV